MNNKGFSLIELLIVILVLAIITGIAIPVYWLITARARETATESEMVNIAKALEIHITEKTAYPTTAEYPDALEDNNYMAVVPVTDAWNNNYSYTSDGINYVLRSRGVDGVSGNSDDIAISDGSMTEDGVYQN